MLPGWLERLPTDHRSSQGRRLIDDAYRGVKIDLHQVDLAAASIAESEIVDELVRYKTIELGETSMFLNGSSDSSRVSQIRLPVRQSTATRLRGVRITTTSPTAIGRAQGIDATLR